MFYSFISLLVVFTIYRPFVTRLDVMKYVIMGGGSLILPLLLEHSTKSTSASLNNGTYVTATALPDQHITHEHVYFFENKVTLLMLTSSIVTVCGLLSRWQFPITFIKPSANPYLSGFLRHGISLYFLYLALR